MALIPVNSGAVSMSPYSARPDLAIRNGTDVSHYGENLVARKPELKHSLCTQKQAQCATRGSSLGKGYALHFETCSPVVSRVEFGAFRSFEDRAQEAQKSAMRVTPEQLRLLPLSEALDNWFQHVKAPAIKKERTRESYTLYRKNIRQHEIGKLLVAQLNLGHLIEYQNERKGQVCVSYVNHETNMIAQLLKYCDLWSYIGKHFRQLPPPDWRPPKVLTQEEEEKFFKVVAEPIKRYHEENPGKFHPWAVAYWTVSVSNNTSATGVELRTLQLKHIFITGEWANNPKIHVPDETAKNQFRARVIPLNEVALKQIERLLERARKLGAFRQDDYLFPLRIARGKWDVTRPASRSYIRKPFEAMRKATGFDWLQPRNFRNQILTKLFEAGVPDETIMAIAGHTSINMSRFYSQIRLDAKKEALSALVPKTKAVQNAG